MALGVRDSDKRISLIEVRKAKPCHFRNPQTTVVAKNDSSFELRVCARVNKGFDLTVSEARGRFRVAMESFGQQPGRKRLAKDGFVEEADGEDGHIDSRRSVGRVLVKPDDVVSSDEGIKVKDVLAVSMIEETDHPGMVVGAGFLFQITKFSHLVEELESLGLS